MDEVSAASTSLFYPAGGRYEGSDRSTSANTSRLHQLAASFHLSDTELAFFDAVVAGLPLASRSFAQLKEAYLAQLAVSGQLEGIAYALDLDPETESVALDARLWNTLLALVEVRGDTWAERWDTVRVALGLEPVASSDESEDDTLDTELSPRPWDLRSSRATLRSPSRTPSGAAHAASWRAYDTPLHAVHAREALSSDEDVSVLRDRSTADLDTVWKPTRPTPRTTAAALSPFPRTSSPVRTSEAMRSALAWDTARTCLSYMQRWRRAFLRRKDVQKEAARAHQQYVVLRAWAQWQRRMVHTATHAAQARVFARESLVHRAWTAWLAALRNAREVRREHRQRILRDAYYQVDARRSRSLVAVAFTVGFSSHQLWTHAADRRLAVAWDKANLLRPLWKLWQDRTDGAMRLATAQAALLARRTHRTLAEVFSHWRQRRSHTQAMERRAATFAHEHMHARLRPLFLYWIVRERGAYALHVRAWDAKRSAWDAWWVKYTERTVARKGTCQHLPSPRNDQHSMARCTHAGACVDAMDGACAEAGAAVPPGGQDRDVPPAVGGMAALACAVRKDRAADRGRHILCTPRAACRGMGALGQGIASEIRGPSAHRVGAPLAYAAVPRYAEPLTQHGTWPLHSAGIGERVRR